ncbi:MAG: rod-binding protein [Fimbriimonadales bacterium]|nr:MAG: hypothetical protein KatS3mg018_0691 [Fimbriimonadales bacterium]
MEIKPRWNTEAKIQQAEAPLPHSKTHDTEAAPPHAENHNPALLRACKEFESIFVVQLWRAMQRTVPKQSQTLNYTEMFDLQFADYLSRQGGLGIAEQLYEQLSRHLPDTRSER